MGVVTKGRGSEVWIGMMSGGEAGVEETKDESDRMR